MKIEVTEKGSKEFYEELVNVISQYKRLLKYPDSRLKDNFRSLRSMTIIMGALFLINLMCVWSAGLSTLNVLAMVMVAIAGIVAYLYRNNMKKMVERYLADERTSVVTLDENGVEINKEGGEIVRLPWESVAFVRSFVKSVCFVSKDVTGLVLAVSKQYVEEIWDYLDQNEIDVKIYRGI